MVAAIMAGSLAWWIFLANLISRFRHRVQAAHLETINQIAGLALIGFGAVLIGEMAVKHGIGLGH
jgi:F0F1-type ATP synthase membrane subunit a